MGNVEKSGEQVPGNNPELDIRTELARRVYSKADELRLHALAKVGLDPLTSTLPVRHRVTLKSNSSRLQVDIGVGEQLRVAGSLRSLIIRDSPTDGEAFQFGRYVEPNGTMWQSADSSQGDPWYPADLPAANLVEAIGKLEKLESSSYQIDVTLSAYQHVDAARSVA